MLPAHQNSAFLDPALDSRARMLRQQARQGTIQPLTRQFRRNFEIDHLELCTHMGTRSYRRGIGYTAALSGPANRAAYCKESLVRLRDLVQPGRVLVIAIGLMMLATGCRSHRADEAKSGPEQIYAKAQKAIRSNNFTEAVKQLEALQSRFPFSEPARQAQLDLIYAYYKSHQTDPAVDAADTFIRENPTNPRVDYAYYMKGLVYFERQSNWLERRFRVDLSQRPPINAKKSFDAFQQLIEKYPHSQYVGDAQQRMVYLRNRLADFELHVALYYMRRGAFVGALNRAKYCVENYDGAPAVKGSMRVIVAAYYSLNMVDLAKDAERVYADNYPGPLKDLEPKKRWYQRII
jgi:outer membrane protein assembly factor BamD